MQTAHLDNDSQSTLTPKVYLETFGCQMNTLDSELVRDQLSELGYEFVKTPEQANVVLYNTCSVRALSEQKVLSRLGIMRARKEAGEDVIVGVLGCMAERANTDILQKNNHVDLLVGPSKLNQVPGLINNLLMEQKTRRATQLSLSDFRARKGKTINTAAFDDLEALDSARALSDEKMTGQAYVRITRGCNKFCSFCVVPRTRGPEVHRNPNTLIDEVKRLADKGVLEVTLLGQTINHYDFTDDNGKKTSFAELLYRIHEEVPHLPRLRFMTSYPRDFTDEALDVMASCDRISKYLHIPAQSGSNSVLARMNRGYTREIYMDLIERAKARMPGLSILGDMIVGFPGETDEDFEASLSLIREVRYKNIYVFKYSPRPNTVAIKNLVDDIPVHVKRERNQRMLDVQNEIVLEHHKAMIGKTYPVIVEGLAKIDPSKRETVKDADGNELISLTKKRSSDIVRLTARTAGDHIVAFDGPKSLIGQIVKVKANSASMFAVTGELVV